MGIVRPPILVLLLRKLSGGLLRTIVERWIDGVGIAAIVAYQAFVDRPDNAWDFATPYVWAVCIIMGVHVLIATAQVWKEGWGATGLPLLDVPRFFRTKILAVGGVVVALLIFPCYVVHSKAITASESNPTSDIELTDIDKVSFGPGIPISGKLTFHNRGEKTLIVHSCRRDALVPEWPKNDFSIRHLVDERWLEWEQALPAEDCESISQLEIPGNGQLSLYIGKGHVPTDSKELFDSAKAEGSLVTLLVFGFMQYSDSKGRHQTDYCFWSQGLPSGVFYRGNIGGIIACNTHQGPSKPTPLR